MGATDPGHAQVGVGSACEEGRSFCLVLAGVLVLFAAHLGAHESCGRRRVEVKVRISTFSRWSMDGSSLCSRFVGLGRIEPRLESLRLLVMQAAFASSLPPPASSSPSPLIILLPRLGTLAATHSHGQGYVYTLLTAQPKLL